MSSKVAAAKDGPMLFDVSRRTLRRYAPGDLFVIAVFVAIGELAHGSNPLAVLVAFAQTAVTFGVGWVVVAPLVGAYRSETLSDRWLAIGFPVLAWVGADAIAQLLRSTRYFEGNAALSFYLVALAFGGLLLGAWRALAYRYFVE
ncbi:MAG: DUF3054 domain-containing protein [Halanaeroarchaeum sp.]